MAEPHCAQGTAIHLKYYLSVYLAYLPTSTGRCWVPTRPCMFWCRKPCPLHLWRLPWPPLHHQMLPRWFLSRPPSFWWWHPQSVRRLVPAKVPMFQCLRPTLHSHLRILMNLSISKVIILFSHLISRYVRFLYMIIMILALLATTNHDSRFLICK